MAEQLSLFLRDNEGIKKVSESEYAEILMWANKMKYIRLKKCKKEYWYTDLQLETAKMWKEKEDSHCE